MRRSAAAARPPPCTVPTEFFARLGRDQLIGFGEAYLTGAWGTQRPSELGELPRRTRQRRCRALVPAPLQKLRSARRLPPPGNHRGSRKNTRDNIAHHYDLSNDLFGLFLDSTLSYSAALFDGDPALGDPRGPRARPGTQDRAAPRPGRCRRGHPGARDRHRLGRAGDPGRPPGRQGSLDHALHGAAQPGAGTGRGRRDAGRVTIELCDYRAVSGEYDAVVSVEMIEAVGWEYWRTYFETIDRVLAPGGRVAIQAITMPHDRMLATRRTYTWINKYIFPGGFLPSVRGNRRDHPRPYRPAARRPSGDGAALRCNADDVGRGFPRERRPGARTRVR